MCNYLFLIPRFLFPVFFLFLITPMIAQGQKIVPDEQIKMQMLAYVAQAENALALSRPRVVQNTDFKAPGPRETVPVNSKRISRAASSFELQAFEIINQRRAENGLGPLEWNEEIASVARLHSENMAQNRFFSHTGLDGSMVNDRADSLGISNWRSIGENIAFNRGFKKPVESACEQWMNSASHRGNILDKRWKQAGIGMAIAPDGTYYFTQVFVVK
jgi:uncharacterized protein YkwD